MSGIIGTSGSKSSVIGRSLDTATAWADMSTSGNSINASFNVSSIDDLDIGRHDVNFITAMSNTNYATVITPGALESGNNITPTSGTRSTTKVKMWIRYLNWQNSSGYSEGSNVGIIIFGGR